MHLRQLSKPTSGSSACSTWPPCTITPLAPTSAAALQHLLDAACGDGMRIRLLVEATLSG